MDISKDEKIIEWLININAAKHTRETYINFMGKFCQCIGKTPSELISEGIAEIKAGKISDERKIGSYIAKFKQMMMDKGFASNTFNVGMYAVRSFYDNFEIPIPKKSRKSKNGGIKEENNNWLKREDIIKMIANAKNLREKAIILFMATSGTARNEILNLQMKDIKIDSQGIGTVNIRRDKTHVDYFTFISPEATLALKNYTDERNRPITILEKDGSKKVVDAKTKVKGEDDYVFVTYTDGKQVNEETFSGLFTIMGKQLGYEVEGGYIKSRSHALRKFFSSTLNNDAGLPKDKIEFMIGHTVNPTDKAYYFQHEDKLKELYIKGLECLKFEKNIKVMSLTGEDAKSLYAKNEELEKMMGNVRNLLKDELGIDIAKSDFADQLSEFRKKDLKIIDFKKDLKK